MISLKVPVVGLEVSIHCITSVLCCLHESLLCIMSSLVSFMQTNRTVLHYAAELGFHDAAKLLLAKQADANAVDKVGHSKILVCFKVVLNL